MKTGRLPMLAAALVGACAPLALHAADGGGGPVPWLALLAATLLATALGWWLGRRRHATASSVDVGSMIDADGPLFLALCGSGDGFWTWDLKADQVTWSLADPDGTRCIRHSAASVPNSKKLSVVELRAASTASKAATQSASATGSACRRRRSL